MAGGACIAFLFRQAAWSLLALRLLTLSNTTLHLAIVLFKSRFALHTLPRRLIFLMYHLVTLGKLLLNLLAPATLGNHFVLDLFLTLGLFAPLDIFLDGQLHALGKLSL